MMYNIIRLYSLLSRPEEPTTYTVVKGIIEVYCLLTIMYPYMATIR